MILVDTNVIIDFWNDPDETLREVFRKESVAICGIVKAELLHGARTENDLSTISLALSDLDYIPLDESIWDEVGHTWHRLRKVALPFHFKMS